MLGVGAIRLVLLQLSLLRHQPGAPAAQRGEWTAGAGYRPGAAPCPYATSPRRPRGVAPLLLRPTRAALRHVEWGVYLPGAAGCGYLSARCAAEAGIPSASGQPPPPSTAIPTRGYNTRACDKGVPTFGQSRKARIAHPYTLSRHAYLNGPSGDTPSLLAHVNSLAYNPSALLQQRQAQERHVAVEEGGQGGPPQPPPAPPAPPPPKPSPLASVLPADAHKREQHERLMDEFRRAHRKMFAHAIVEANAKGNAKGVAPSPPKAAVPANTAKADEVSATSRPV